MSNRNKTPEKFSPRPWKVMLDNQDGVKSIKIITPNASYRIIPEVKPNVRAGQEIYDLLLMAAAPDLHHYLFLAHPVVGNYAKAVATQNVQAAVILRQLFMEIDDTLRASTGNDERPEDGRPPQGPGIVGADGVPIPPAA